MAGPFDIRGYEGTNHIVLDYEVTVTDPNSILIVASNPYGGPGTGGFTYDGVAMTRAIDGDQAHLFYLLNPAIGTHTLAADSDNIGAYGVIAAVFTEIDIDAPVSGADHNYDHSLDIVAPANSVVVDVLTANTNPTVVTPTQIGAALHVGAYHMVMGYLYSSAGGTVTMNWQAGVEFFHTGMALGGRSLPSVVWW
jgi:hypothetical protein